MNDTTFQGDGKIAFVPVVVNAKQPKQTNADRIRSMTDEELAKLLDNAIVSCGGVMGGRNCMADCRKCWLDWLRQEVDDDNHDN